MITLVQMLLVVGLNLIPAGGVLFRHWTPATALTLYWSENLVSAVLIVARIAIHQRLTGTQGHARSQLNVRIGTTPDSRQPRSSAAFLSEFIVASLGFTFAHGLLLMAVLGLVIKTRPDASQIGQGLRWMLVAQLVGFCLDLYRIRKWSFARLKQTTDMVLGRVGVIHLSLIGGLFFGAFSTRSQVFFAVFAVMKTMSDLLGQFQGSSRIPAEAPAWLLWLAALFRLEQRMKTGQDLATWWRETSLAAQQRVVEDERVVEGLPLATGKGRR